VKKVLCIDWDFSSCGSFPLPPVKRLHTGPYLFRPSGGLLAASLKPSPPFFFPFLHFRAFYRVLVTGTTFLTADKSSTATKYGDISSPGSLFRAFFLTLRFRDPPSHQVSTARLLFSRFFAPPLFAKPFFPSPTSSISATYTPRVWILKRVAIIRPFPCFSETQFIPRCRVYEAIRTDLCRTSLRGHFPPPLSVFSLSPAFTFPRHFPI